MTDSIDYNKCINEIASYLTCPITKQIYAKPIVASDGHTYEDEAFINWTKLNSLSPMTRQTLNKSKTNNRALLQIRNIILKYFPQYENECYLDKGSMMYSKNRNFIISIINENKDAMCLTKYFEYDIYDLLVSLNNESKLFELDVNILNYIIDNNINKYECNQKWASLLHGKSQSLIDTFVKNKLISSSSVPKMHEYNKEAIKNILLSNDLKDKIKLLEYTSFMLSEFKIVSSEIPKETYAFSSELFSKPAPRYLLIKKLCLCNNQIISHVIQNTKLYIYHHLQITKNSIFFLVCFEYIATEDDAKLAEIINSINIELVKHSFLLRHLLMRNMFQSYKAILSKHNFNNINLAGKINDEYIVDYLCKRKLTEELKLLLSFENISNHFDNTVHKTIEMHLIATYDPIEFCKLINTFPQGSICIKDIINYLNQTDKVTQSIAVAMINILKQDDTARCNYLIIALIKRYPSLLKEVILSNKLNLHLFFHDVPIFDHLTNHVKDIIREIFSSSHFTLEHYNKIVTNNVARVLETDNDDLLPIYYCKDQVDVQIINEYLKTLATNIEHVSNDAVFKVLYLLLKKSNSFVDIKLILTKLANIKEKGYEIFAALAENSYLSHQEKYNLLQSSTWIM
jgi:hypothetical protein